ncbi:hypothetical protein ABZP36_023667 [Zizania latifolia]
MISSGSDGSPENSPTRTTFGKEEKGEKKVSSENVDDGDAAAQNKGKKATGTRRKSPSIQEAIDAFDKHEGPSMEEKQDKLPKRSTPKKNLVTLSSCCDASPGNSPSRAGTANEEEDSYTFKIEHGQQGKGKKSKVTGPKDGPEGKTNKKCCLFSENLICKFLSLSDV